MATYNLKDVMEKKKGTFEIKTTNGNYGDYEKQYVQYYGLPSHIPLERDMILLDLQQPIRYQVELPSIERRQFGEFGTEIKRLETKIERLEKALASKSIPRHISTSIVERFAKETVNRELDENLFEPLSKGIAFATGITAIVSLLLVSVIMFFPLALLSGMFWWSYYKFRQRRIHPYIYYTSEKISEKSDTMKWKKSIPSPE